MAKRKSQKNQIVDVDLVELIPEDAEYRTDYDGVKLLLRRVEPDLARDWSMRQRALFLEEKRRRIQDKEADQILGDDMSNEFLEDFIKLGHEILEATVVGMRHIEGIGEQDQDGALDEIVYLDIAGAVKERAQEIQTLSARQRFRAEGTGSGGAPADPAGPQ